MQKPTYRLVLGSGKIDSVADKPPVLIDLVVSKDMDVPVDTLNVNLSGISKITAKTGDRVSLELGNDDSPAKVMMGTVDKLTPTLFSLGVTAFGSFSRLIGLRVDQVYVGKPAGDIVKDLAQKAGVTVSKTESGIDLPAYVVDQRQNAYVHCRELARKCGFDLYCDEEDKLVFSKFTKKSADHTFSYGKDILYLEVAAEAPIAAGVAVFGESPASSQGKDTWSWFTKDFSGSSGSAGGQGGVLIQDPSIRVKEAASTYAEAEFKRFKKMANTGVVKIIGKPEVKLGDAIEIKDCPDASVNAVYQVRSIEHILNKTEGFVSRIGFCGLGD